MTSEITVQERGPTPALSDTGLLPLALPIDSPAQNAALAYLLTLKSQRSKRTMWSTLNRIARILGGGTIYTCPWQDVRNHHVELMLAALNFENKSPATCNTYLAAIKGVARQAWVLKQLSSDDLERLKYVKSVSGYRLPRGRRLPPVEIKALLHVCDRDSSPSGVRDGAMVGLLIGCGLRRDELVRLNLSDFDANNDSVNVLGKGNKERTAYLPLGSKTRLECWIEEVRGRVAGPMFTRVRRHGDVTMDRLSDQAVYYVLSKRGIEAGIEEFSPHDLRRTYASWLLDNGEDLLTVRDAMGHQSVTTTQRYDKRDEERVRKASRKLDL